MVALPYKEENKRSVATAQKQFCLLTCRFAFSFEDEMQLFKQQRRLFDQVLTKMLSSKNCVAPFKRVECLPFDDAIENFPVYCHTAAHILVFFCLCLKVGISLTMLIILQFLLLNELLAFKLDLLTNCQQF